MIGPLLVVFFLVRAWTGHGHELPCVANTCGQAVIVAQAKEDPRPIVVDMGPRPQLAEGQILPRDSAFRSPIGLPKAPMAGELAQNSGVILRAPATAAK